MNVIELKNALKKQPAASVQFLLPNGELIPAHAHVTEVARIDKRFMDCGGTLRNETLCRLQTWVADDYEHRLLAGKLAGILEKAGGILQSDDLAVDVEHEVGFISQFPLVAADFSADAITLRLGKRHTACLAMDRCQPPASVQGREFNLLKTEFKSGQPGDCCRSGN